MCPAKPDLCSAIRDFPDPLLFHTSLSKDDEAALRRAILRVPFAIPMVATNIVPTQTRVIQRC